MGGGQIVYVFPFFMGKRETHKQNSQSRDNPVKILFMCLLVYWLFPCPKTGVCIGFWCFCRQDSLAIRIAGRSVMRIERFETSKVSTHPQASDKEMTVVTGMQGSNLRCGLLHWGEGKEQGKPQNSRVCPQETLRKGKETFKRTCKISRRPNVQQLRCKMDLFLFVLFLFILFCFP